MTFLTRAFGVADGAVVATTILHSIYLPVKPLDISPACIDKHCFGVRSGTPRLGSWTTPSDSSPTIRKRRAVVRSRSMQCN
jgi:hypothetical protein